MKRTKTKTKRFENYMNLNKSFESRSWNQYTLKFIALGNSKKHYIFLLSLLFIVKSFKYILKVQRCYNIHIHSLFCMFIYTIFKGYVLFIMLRYISSILNLLRAFTMKGCCILSNAFSASIEIIIWFLSFILLMWCITFIHLHMLNHLCIPGINPPWS